MLPPADPTAWWRDRLLEERGLHRDVRLDVTDWHSVLTMGQHGVGISYGPGACIDLETFDRLDLVTLAGASSWELGVVPRDDGLRGAAGRAFLATYGAPAPAALRQGDESEARRQDDQRRVPHGYDTFKHAEHRCETVVLRP